VAARHDGVPGKDIAAVLGVTEQRVSAILMRE
jgi:hypothetical protein